MNTDPTYQRLLEASWRRALTAEETAELNAWLEQHPEAAAGWQAEAGLRAALERLPDAPMPSNFTALVLQGVERASRDQERLPGRPPLSAWRWLWGRLPRIAFGLLLAGAGLFSYHQVKTAERLEYAQSLEAVSAVAPVSSPQVLEDFDAIRALSRSPQADQELLTLMQ